VLTRLVSLAEDDVARCQGKQRGDEAENAASAIAGMKILEAVQHLHPRAYEGQRSREIAQLLFGNHDGSSIAHGPQTAIAAIARTFSP